MVSRILVIDDDSGWRRWLIRVLGEAGYDVIDAADGRIGLQRYRQHRPELVITDLFMPEQDGLETIRALRKGDPVPRILVISGGGFGGQMDLLDVAVRLGADRALRKPIAAGLLLDSVRALIGAPAPR